MMEITKCTTNSLPHFPFIQFRSRFPRKNIPNPVSTRRIPRCKFALGCMKSSSLPNFEVAGEMDGAGDTAGGKFDMLLEIENGDMLLEMCVTRCLAPVLSVENGLENIQKEVEKLKLNPPCSSRGVLRFQVAIPPSPKALRWFSCQPESSGVFPQFFLSRDNDSENLNCNAVGSETRGVFGIGSAFHCRHYFDGRSPDWISFKRYLSPGSSLLMSYGFMNIETDLCYTKSKAGSCYLFVPQVELDEHQSLSILAATLAWDDSSHTLGDAIGSLELSLQQATRSYCSISDQFSSQGQRSSIKRCNIVNDSVISMVDMKTLLFDGEHVRIDPVELKEASSVGQYVAKISSSFSIASNMSNYALESELSVQGHPNINAAWAWLMIDECTRLGLKYFCIAPGSRSSPLAVAASTHPLANCVACYDERSLAFHAVGYARGSQLPAVVITTSGTAVSNLLPAVVEASQDFLPLILLTADRPPELQCVGANQAINQVDHFGSFTRFFFNLPTATDEIHARMVLTTLDSAVNLATTTPCGPVHINCPFREPLDNSPSKWKFSSLKGLDFWMSSAEPFTKYVQLNRSPVSKVGHYQISGIIKVLQGAKQGLVLLGALNTEDETWAALLLAKHLAWPVVPDVLSNFRLRKRLSPFDETESNIFFLDYLDHLLLSDLVRSWAQADVILQIGSRITSKRISQMLEECYPMSYIMVDRHPYRHDPSHLVTHRIQSTATEFAASLLKAQFPPLNSEWIRTLRILNTMVEAEISFQICSHSSLTEPYIAYAISEALSSENALFIGNSMTIRDADMYGRSYPDYSRSILNTKLGLGLPCQEIKVAANRGASGIDGLLSTAVGYAVGCQKRVLCLLGDVSFLYDTNGLAILNQRIHRKPLTVIVINNHGGGIFRLLPISNTVERIVMEQFFYTSHNVSISNLCEAHGVKYMQVKTKLELEGALLSSKHEQVDVIIEAESGIDANATFHRDIRNSASETADAIFAAVSRNYLPDSVHYERSACKIHKMEFSLFRISLYEQPTSDTISHDPTLRNREGFILTIHLEDGTVGHGEVSPLDILKEPLLDVEEQLCFLLHTLKGVKISYVLPLMKGCFATWIWSNIGVPPSSIFPSVRCGLEVAILNALAARKGTSLFKLLCPRIREDSSGGSFRIKVCGLIDSNGTPTQMAQTARLLVEEGFSAVKIKVARQPDPFEDAEVIKEVRKAVGGKIAIRADANRKWCYEEAVQFAHYVKNYNLQYVEEPVQNDDDILKFCEETGLAVALDETLYSIKGDPVNYLTKFNHPGIAAVVIKPTVVGGFENAALLARWAQQQGKTAVISSAFESSLGLAALVQFSSYVNSQDVDVNRIMNKDTNSFMAHGLGTYKWLKEDVSAQSLNITRKLDTGIVEAHVADADELLKKFQIRKDAVLKSSDELQVHTYHLNLDSSSSSCSIKVQEMGANASNNVLVFLHGFLGTGEDWVGIMKAVSGSARCISFDIPGHGGSRILNSCNGDGEEFDLSMEVIAYSLQKLICQLTPHKVTLVGYSMGARIALYMALKHASKVQGAVIISGSPGLKDEVTKKIRRKIDDSRARSLYGNGLQLFLDNWYAGELWDSLRGHPHFQKIIASRSHHDDLPGLAKSLSDLSIGRQQSLWEDLKSCRTPLLIIVGAKDRKFKKIAQQMLHELNSSTLLEGNKTTNGTKTMAHQMVEVPDCGHAVHLENPLPVIKELRQFLARIED